MTEEGLTPDIHVIPENDLREHSESADCWCAPRLEGNGAPWVVVHHSADRREWRERTGPPLRASATSS
jgi:hypothetical protein